MANLDAFLGGYSAGNQMAEQGRQQRNRATIQSLAPQVIGGDPQAFSKAAALDPQAATGLQQSGEGMIRRARGAAQYLQKALQGGNPMEISAARRTIKPYMDTLKPGSQYPLDMDPNQEAAGIQSFLAETQMYDPMLAKGIPADVQSMRLMSEGLSAEDQLKARRINLGLEGRAASSGFSQVKFTGADGRERIGVLNGKTGQIDLPDGTSFNPQTGQVSATQQGQGARTPSVQSGGLDIASDAQQFSALGIPVSSTVRTADRNRQVGGVGNSYHLTGEALDIAPQNPQQKQQARQFWEGRGYQVIDEGDHLHVEPPSRGATISRLGGAPNVNSFVGRSPEEQAALTEQAKADVQLANLPQELNLKTEAALREAEAKAGIERASKKQGIQDDNNRTFNMYESAMGGVIEGLGGSSTGPLIGRLPAITSNQQIAEGSVSAIAPVLKQLFRAAGEGTFTDKDQELLMAMIPTRTDTPAARNWKIRNIDAIVRQKLGQPEIGGQSSAPASPPQRGGQSRSVVRTGQLNGRRVVQYSDGSTEYAD